MHSSSFLTSLYLLSRGSESCTVHTDRTSEVKPMQRLTSIADALESKRIDPEMFLKNLGFVHTDHSLLDRLPTRFFIAQRDQALTNQFLSKHPEFQESEQLQAVAAVTEVLTRIPPCFYNIQTTEPCTTLHKIVASHSPLAKQQLMKQSPVFSSFDQIIPSPKTKVDSKMYKQRKSRKHQHSLTAIGEFEQLASETASISSGALSSCDVTDESSDEEDYKPIVLNNRMPVLHLFNQQEVIDLLVENSEGANGIEEESDAESCEMISCESVEDSRITRCSRTETIYQTIDDTFSELGMSPTSSQQQLQSVKNEHISSEKGNDHQNNIVETSRRSSKGLHRQAAVWSTQNSGVDYGNADDKLLISNIILESPTSQHCVGVKPQIQAENVLSDDVDHKQCDPVSNHSNLTENGCSQSENELCGAVDLLKREPMKRHDSLSSNLPDLLR